MKWRLNWFLIEIEFEIYLSSEFEIYLRSVLNSPLNLNWTQDSLLKLESSQKQLGNHLAASKSSTLIQQFYFTGDFHFFVSGFDSFKTEPVINSYITRPICKVLYKACNQKPFKELGDLDKNFVNNIRYS